EAPGARVGPRLWPAARVTLASLPPSGVAAEAGSRSPYLLSSASRCRLSPPDSISSPKPSTVLQAETANRRKARRLKRAACLEVRAINVLSPLGAGEAGHQLADARGNATRRKQFPPGGHWK